MPIKCPRCGAVEGKGKGGYLSAPWFPKDAPPELVVTFCGCFRGVERYDATRDNEAWENTWSFAKMYQYYERVFERVPVPPTATQRQLTNWYWSLVERWKQKHQAKEKPDENTKPAETSPPSQPALPDTP